MKSKSSLFVGLLLLPTSAWAQTPGSVSTGATEVANEGKEKVAAAPAEITDATELSLQGGGLLAGGNSKTFALTTSAKFLLRRAESEFNASAAMNYAQSVPRNDDGTLMDNAGMNPTVENYQGRLRYDYFFDTNVSGFFAVSGRRDRFQQLDLRLGIDPGVSAYLLRNDELKLWGELGYNLQVDDFSETGQAARLAVDPDATDPLVDHNVRVYLGYQHRLDTRLSLDTGVELFKSVVREDGFRFNFGAQLTTQLVDRFSFAVGVLTLFDNTPVPGVDRLDVQSSLSFVYSLL